MKLKFEIRTQMFNEFSKSKLFYIYEFLFQLIRIFSNFGTDFFNCKISVYFRVPKLRFGTRYIYPNFGTVPEISVQVVT